MVAPAGRLHPLLHRDTSSSGETSYTSSFTGDERFLSDHRIFGQRILPGAAYVEMARAALAAGLARGETDVIRLQDLAWIRPLVVADAVALHLRLAPAGTDESFVLEFRADADGAPYCRGRARVAAADGALGRHDLAALRQRCTPAPLSIPEYYERFGAVGIDYGPAHRGLAALDVACDLVIARLELPDVVRDEADDFGLHPSLLDAAFQAVIAMPDPQLDPAGGAAVPFWVREVSIARRLGPVQWAVLRRSAGAGEGGRGRPPLDIDLSDAEGAIVTRFEGYLCKPFKGQSDAAAARAPVASGNRAQSSTTLRLLMRLRAGYDAAAVHCITAGGMTPLSFVPLARALDRLTVAVLDQRPLLEAETAAPRTVQETATAFIRALVAETARGPYLLVGHSFGGSVAFEMARQLEDGGHTVRLCMLDSPFYISTDRLTPATTPGHPGYFLGEQSLVAAACADIADESAILANLTAAAKQSITQQLGLSLRANAGIVDQIASLYARQIMLYRAYRPSGVFRGDVHVLLATDSILGGANLADTLQHYRSHMTGSIEVTTVAGGHLSLLRRENVGSLAAAVRACADALFAAPGRTRSVE